jgi:hypothetical protein
LNADGSNDEVGDGSNMAFAIGAPNVGAGTCSFSGGPLFFYAARKPDAGRTTDR